MELLTPAYSLDDNFFLGVPQTKNLRVILDSSLFLIFHQIHQYILPALPSKYIQNVTTSHWLNQDESPIGIHGPFINNCGYLRMKKYWFSDIYVISFPNNYQVIWTKILIKFFVTNYLTNRTMRYSFWSRDTVKKN